ncbi:uncharacterized membrane protein YvlD (DUF360 family) [Catenuloplanes nepalensis]|uniref:Uncharacterized membrane protein YvlD (DUF360 family) n=1 Tax=Catenuloplanes nepalensis TaxID=587533 RepID=A0ABT9MTT2_9ACTN|nr:hypothetical protein [Catenuloplanes nepalensis]MDP9794858.1 uncharacterized membrane protein YvlD (DUF360 family) [Catenuloplanes nepalensis]
MSWRARIAIVPASVLPALSVLVVAAVADDLTFGSAWAWLAAALVVGFVNSGVEAAYNLSLRILPWPSPAQFVMRQSLWGLCAAVVNTVVLLVLPLLLNIVGNDASATLGAALIGGLIGGLCFAVGSAVADIEMSVGSD